MKSSKWILGLTVVALIMALAPASFAQVRIEVTTFPSAGEVQTNRNATTQDPSTAGTGIQVSGLFIASSRLTTTQLRLDFGAAITAAPIAIDNTMQGVGLVAPTLNVPPADPIRIEGGSGLFANVTAVATIDYAGGRITINLPCRSAAPGAVDCTGADNGASGTFRLLGVRLDLNGRTAPVNVVATLNSGANNYLTPTAPTQPVISAIGANFTGPTIGVEGTANVNNGTLLFFSNQLNAGASDALGTISITEGFASAWRSAAQFTPSPISAGVTVTNGTQFRVTIDNLPTGITATLTSAAASTTAPRVLAVGAFTGGGCGAGCLTRPGTTTATANNNRTTFTLAGTPSLTNVERVVLQITLGGTATGNLTAGTNLVVNVTTDPVGDALDANGLPTMTGGYPRFASDTASLTIGQIVAATTTALIPYAVRIPSLNFETGIALANTTADPFTSGGATAQAGTVTLDLFPSTATGAGTRSTYVSNTANRAGSGMASDGTIPAGAVWAVNLSDILSKATPAFTGDFSGYIFVQAGFLNLHGVAYVYDGRGFTSNTPVLVLPPPSQTPRTTPAASVEALNN